MEVIGQFHVRAFNTRDRNLGGPQSRSWIQYRPLLGTSLTACYVLRFARLFFPCSLFLQFHKLQSRALSETSFVQLDRIGHRTSLWNGLTLLRIREVPGPILNPDFLGFSLFILVNYLRIGHDRILHHFLCVIHNHTAIRSFVA